MSTTSFRRGDVVLAVVPYSDYRGSKLRPAVVAGARHPSDDEILVPLSSRVSALSPGEFVLPDWANAGLNVPSKVRRFLLTTESREIRRRVGRLSSLSQRQLDQSLKMWLALS